MPADTLREFSDGLRELGWTEAQNGRFEWEISEEPGTTNSYRRLRLAC